VIRTRDTRFRKEPVEVSLPARERKSPRRNGHETPEHRCLTVFHAQTHAHSDWLWPFRLQGWIASSAARPVVVFDLQIVAGWRSSQNWPVVPKNGPMCAAYADLVDRADAYEEGAPLTALAARVRTVWVQRTGPTQAARRRSAMPFTYATRRDPACSAAKGRTGACCEPARSVRAGWRRRTAGSSRRSRQSRADVAAVDQPFLIGRAATPGFVRLAGIDAWRLLEVTDRQGSVLEAISRSR
jgi:hypothetical protein